ncbi:lipo-like protein [Marinobacterium rhizophilum]|uniref:Lipo-like protein n=2 Tax=Marinobacterium rhizophilum TaxID=420402 RepID=A0ABY5HSZ2_9GAMM|nr:lipo-like protein [Marinobacterium rhizophilum]
MLEFLGHRLSVYLSHPRDGLAPRATSSADKLHQCLLPGDVLLVEGTSRISTAIKYLTQSTWSHAAFCIGHALDGPEQGARARVLIEADVSAGVRAVSLGRYEACHTRICRPVGLAPTEVKVMTDFLVARLGQQYDHKNILDLARFLFPTPPVPSHWRRHMLHLGSGDPTRAICSSLIAEAFQTVAYPILPREVQPEHSGFPVRLFRRHPSLFTPRDFDVSPYFRVIKPMLEAGYVYRRIVCMGDPEAAVAPSGEHASAPAGRGD